MVKEKRRNWLTKISRWILGALPDGEPPDPLAQLPTQQPTQQAEQELLHPSAQPEPLDPAGPTAPSQPPAPRDYSINQAWKAFASAWSTAGLSDHYFLEQEELEQTLAVLDRSFEEELIEWLFQLSTNPDAIKDLARIIERGQIRSIDNIDAIRAFAYVSVAIASKPRRSAPRLVADCEPTGGGLEPDSQPDAQQQPESPGQRPTPIIPRSELALGDLNSRYQAANLSVSSINEGLQGSQADSRLVDNIPLEELELSVRSYNCLKRADIHTLLDLAGKTEESLVAIKNFGQKSADEVRQALERRGLALPFTQADILGLSPSKEIEPDLVVISENNHEEDLRSLRLSTRTLNSLYRGGIINVSHLLGHTEADLLAFPKLGSTAIEEINALLSARGLSLMEERSQWRDENSKDREQFYDDPDLEEAWLNFRLFIKRDTGQPNPGYDQLKQICSDYADDPAGKHLADILGRLNATLDFIGETLSHQHRSKASSIQFGLEALRDWIATQLLHRSGGAALQLVNQITKGFTPNQERNWLVYLLRCSGLTLQAIGDSFDTPVTRERARQMEAKIAKITGIKAVDLAERGGELREAAKLQHEREIIQAWLNQLGRLPIQSDQNAASDIHENRLWDQICRMDLKRRSELFKKHDLNIGDTEYDFHYQYVIGRASVGAGYWRDFENLKQFVIRHARALGEPHLMPKQTSFPDAVRGVVTSYGGQSKVAARIGLKYQGQLVGSDGGRRYWTDERLNQLLLDTNRHHQHDPALMPSYGDILEFFTDTQIGEYQDKKAHSAIAALTKMGTLHWSEVAGRFGKRFVGGESQKSVTLSYIKAFVRDLGEHLESLSPSELFVLFQAQGINRGEKEKFSRTFDALVDAVQSGVVDKQELRSWAENNDVESINELLELGAELKAEATSEEKEQKLLERRSRKLMEEFPQHGSDAEIQAEDLPSLEPVKILKALDKAAGIVENSGTDSDKVEFLKAKAAAKLWDACFKDEEELIRKLKAFPADVDSYSREVQQSFIEEYEGARALPIPDAYAFRDLKGHLRFPKLMQRLVAFRLERDFRLLNLSGTGTGKTLSAIYAAQICGCQRLLISCPNGVIESWRRAFSSAFPTANLIIKPDAWELSDVIDGVTVVIVNHERFQDRFAPQILGFCIGYQADMIVIDEIHQSKRRSSDQSSQRRKLMNEFIRISSNINSDLRVLGLSATPVINNLYEGRSLLELICQEPIEDVGETIDLNSCMNLYQHFVVHGIRMNPGQLSRTNLIHQDIDATSLLPQIIWATKKGTYHDIEQLLVAPKLRSLERSLVRGGKTVIFITYIKNTLRPIVNWLEQNGYSYSVYTGDEKEAREEGFSDSLDEFIHGTTEVLVASIQCVGTGVDGLQAVCNRGVFFQLPWTSTEFEQTIGRLDRDGTDFEGINIYMPLTDIVLPHGDRWSWCRSKLDRIESKRDIAKAAVDGEIPDAATLISPSEASKYWLNWLEKLEQASEGISSPLS